MATTSARPREWLTLGEASAFLDIAPVTLRRWANAGKVPTFTTPGGHRRFSRSVLQQLLADGTGRTTIVEHQGFAHGALRMLTPARLRRQYRRERGAASSELPWLTQLNEEQTTWFRERGRRMAALLIGHLDATTPESADHALSEASAIAADYGRMTGRMGLSMGQSVEGFLRFRRPFLHELSTAAHHRGFDARETGTLLESAERSMDRLLVALLGSHGVARVAEVMGHAPATLVGRPHVMGALPAPAAEDQR
jgi:excisionase family DNA binding protein